MCELNTAHLYLFITFERVVQSARARGALCNDFSSATYYLERHENSTGWVVHFEGGGGCTSFADCNARWQSEGGRYRPLMSSRSGEFPIEIAGEDILSSDSLENPLFHNFSHVLVPYCSSDGWLANRTHPSLLEEGQDAMFQFDETSEDADNFCFNGMLIFRAVIEDLLEAGLADAQKVLLVGTSAGGIGILNQLASGWLESSLEGIELKIVVDSSWFIEFQGYSALGWDSSMASQFLGFDACRNDVFGYPCCTSSSCLFTHHLTNISVPILLASSTYDIYVLSQPLQETIEGSGQGATDVGHDLLRQFNAFGAVMNLSLLQSTSAHQALSIFSPSCTQHVYLATSSLWNWTDGVLNNTVAGTYQVDIFHLTNPIRSGSWDMVKVLPFNDSDPISFHEAVVEWYESGGKQIFYADGCSGPVCSSKCTSQVTIDPPRNLWPDALNLVIVIVSLLLTAVCIIAKTAMYLYMKYMLYCQRMFSQQPRQKKRGKRSHPPNAISISCSKLSYRINIVSPMKLSNDKGGDTDTVEKRHQHSWFVKLDLFVPSFLSGLLHRCLLRSSSVGDSRQDNFSPVDVTGGRSRSSTVSSVGSRIPDSDASSVASDGAAVNRMTKTILSKIDLYVNPGELVAVMGPSGSGKTTLLDVLLGKRSSGLLEVRVGYARFVSWIICKCHSW